MNIETKRLSIRALNDQQLRKYILDDYSFELSCQLECGSRKVSVEVKKIIAAQVLPAFMDEAKNYLYYTVWTIVYKEKNTIVADLCFKGEPNDKGEVEIGYGTYPEFQNNGFMTEAIAAISNWALEQDAIKAILAETDKSNIASIRIFEKNEFQIIKRTGDNLYWRLTKED